MSQQDLTESPLVSLLMETIKNQNQTILELTKTLGRLNSQQVFQPHQFEVIEGEPEPQDEEFFEVIDLGDLIPETGSDLMEFDNVSD